MSTSLLDDVKLQLHELSMKVDELISAQRLTGKDIVVPTGMSEINSNMGLFTAGEVRVGNGVQPGLGFSGVRIAYPAMTYDSDDYNLVGVNNDVLQAGIKASDGKFYAGGGSVVLDAEGVKIATDNLAEGVTGVRSIKFIDSDGLVNAGVLCSVSASSDSPRLDILSGNSIFLGSRYDSDHIDVLYNPYVFLAGDRIRMSVWNTSDYNAGFSLESPTSDANNGLQIWNNDPSASSIIQSFSNSVSIQTTPNVLGYTTSDSLVATVTNSSGFYANHKSIGTNLFLNGGFRWAQRQAPGTLTTLVNEKHSADMWRQAAENASLQYQRVSGTAEALAYEAIFEYYGRYKKITNNGQFYICQFLNSHDSIANSGAGLEASFLLRASTNTTYNIAFVQNTGTIDTFPAAIVTGWGSDLTLGANLSVVGTKVQCAVTTTWQRFRISCAASPITPYNNIGVIIWPDGDVAANDTFDITCAQLYRDLVPVDWVEHPWPLELGMLQTYYENNVEADVDPTANGKGKGVTCLVAVVAANEIYATMYFRVTKYKVPVLTIHPYVTAANVARVSQSTTVDFGANSGATVGIGVNQFSLINSSGGNLNISANKAVICAWEADATFY